MVRQGSLVGEKRATILDMEAEHILEASKEAWVLSVPTAIRIPGTGMVRQGSLVGEKRAPILDMEADHILEASKEAWVLSVPTAIRIPGTGMVRQGSLVGEKRATILDMEADHILEAIQQVTEGLEVPELVQMQEASQFPWVLPEDWGLHGLLQGLGIPVASACDSLQVMKVVLIGSADEALLGGLRKALPLAPNGLLDRALEAHPYLAPNDLVGMVSFELDPSNLATVSQELVLELVQRGTLEVGVV